MGMFDTVKFECPNCHKPIDIQSKAGICGLNDYRWTKVPIAIVADMMGDRPICEHCQSKLVISTNLPKYGRLYLDKYEPDMEPSDDIENDN